jgi:hypothetical protein
MKRRNLKAVFAAMLGAYLCACDSNQDTAIQAAGPRQEGGKAGGGFDSAVLAIKAGKSTQEEKNSAIDALVSRYGHYGVTPQIVAPVAPEDGAIQPGPLGKAANVTYYYPKKGQDFGNNFILGTPGLIVHPGQMYISWTARPPGSTADPFLVAYYQTIAGKAVSPIVVVGLNDDYAGSLDSRITWTNQTGSDQTVYSNAFAYSSSTGGTATLVSLVVGGTPQVLTYNMQGLVEYQNNITAPLPADGCSGPISDRLTLRAIARGRYTYCVMLVNSQTMRGGSICNLVDHPSQTLNLPGPATPSGYPNFMLWYATSQSEGSDASGDYPNYAGFQYQAHSCPN